MFYFTGYVVLPVFSGLVTAALAVYAYKKIKFPAAPPVFWMMVGLAAWSFGYAFNLSATAVDLKVLGTIISSLGAQTLGVAAFIMCVIVAGYSSILTKKFVVGISIIPTAIAILIITTPFHQLLRYDFGIREQNSLLLLTFKTAPLYSAQVFYPTLIILAGLLFLAISFPRSDEMERKAIGLIYLATLISIAFNFLPLTPVKGFLPVTSVFWFVGACYALAIFKYKMLDLLPIARDKLFEILPDPVLVVNNEGNIAQANKSAGKMFNFALSPVNPLKIADIFADRPEILSAIAELPDYLVDKAIKEKSSGISWHIVIAPVIAKGRNKKGSLITMRDISELAKAEETARLAQIEAEKASAQKTRFLSMISHEMRTPLHSMLGSAELLSDTKLDENQRAYLNLFIRSGAALRVLLDDALDLSLIEEGRLRLSDVDYAAEEIMDELKSLFSSQFEKKGLYLKIVKSDDLPSALRGDKRRIIQILTNLVGNALKYTESGGVEVVLKREEMTFRIDVGDTGVGIPSDKLTVIFEPFIRLSDKENKTGKSAGLGLWITKNLVCAMNGEIRAVAGKAGGTVFEIRLPLILAERPDCLAPEVDARRRQKTFSNLRILAVDDVPENLMILKFYMNDVNVLISEAENGREAIKLFSEERYDIVLLDIQLPDMLGTEVAAKMRQIEKERGLQKTHIIAVSADAYEKAAKTAVESGCDLYLTRPLSREDLLRTLSQLPKNENKTNATMVDLTKKAKERVAVLAWEAFYSSKAREGQKTATAGHSLKGIGMTFQLTEVEEIGAKIESSAKKGDLIEAGRLAELLLNRPKSSD